jgi:hypothetical protein
MKLHEMVEEKVRSAITDDGSPDVLHTITNGPGEYVIHSGSDAKNRPKLVTLQAAYEATFSGLLKERKLESVIGIIHTPLPATPCRTDGTVTEGLVHNDVARDPARLKTVTKRPNVTRDFLDAGGLLISMYSAPDLEAAQARAQSGDTSGPQVTAESMEIFDGLKKKHPNLIDFPIQEPIENQHSGATYIAKGLDGENYMFSIRAYQAHTPTDATWGLWAGNMREKQAVRNRAQEIGEFLNSHGISEVKNLTPTEAELSYPLRDMIEPVPPIPGQRLGHSSASVSPNDPTIRNPASNLIQFNSGSRSSSRNRNSR